MLEGAQIVLVSPAIKPDATRYAWLPLSLMPRFPCLSPFGRSAATAPIATTGSARR